MSRNQRRPSREAKRDSQEDRTIDQQMTRDGQEQIEVSPSTAQEPKEDMPRTDRRDGQEQFKDQGRDGSGTPLAGEQKVMGWQEMDRICIKQEMARIWQEMARICMKPRYDMEQKEESWPGFRTEGP